MKAIVFHGIGDIRLDDVREPRIREPYDAIVKLTASAICGTDLHMVRGTVPGMKPGTVLGHEGVGIVEDVGKGVRNIRPGDRVVIASTIACGFCSYCRAGYYSQCDHANPNGPLAGTAFFGGPQETGPFDGMQAEKVRVPFANVGLIKLPDDVSDDQAIFLSDIFPTGFFGALLAEVKKGDTVAVFGCGPVGMFAIWSAFHLGASRVFAIDSISTRLATARELGAEAIHFEREDPIEMIRELTGGIGADRAIDAVGVDANCPHHGPAAKKARQERKRFERELEEIVQEAHPHGNNWHPGDGPSQALSWAVDGLAKAGSLGIIGVYPETAHSFPIGLAMGKNITLKMGNCHHRKYIPYLLNLIRSGVVDPSQILSQSGPIQSAIAAYEAFDTRQPGWMKVKLEPAPAARAA